LCFIRDEALRPTQEKKRKLERVSIISCLFLQKQSLDHHHNLILWITIKINFIDKKLIDPENDCDEGGQEILMADRMLSY